jgi:hypothetical protein
MALNWTLPLRGVQLLFGLLGMSDPHILHHALISLVVLILSAVGVNKFGGVFSALNFLLFCVLPLIWLVFANGSGSLLTSLACVLVDGTILLCRVPSYLCDLYVSLDFF